MVNLFKINEYLENFYEVENERKRLYKAIFSLMGYPDQKIGNMLGKNSGGKGDPFKMNDNKVLKITTDKLEACNADVISKNDIEGFAKYYSVAHVLFELPEDKKSKKELYALVMDYVNIIDPNSEIAKYYRILSDKLFKSIDKDGNEVQDFLNFNNVENYFKIFTDMNSVSRLQEVCDIEGIDISKIKPVYDRFMLIMSNAIKYGLFITDVSLGNMALENGEIIIFDLGSALSFKALKSLPEPEKKITVPDLKTVELDRQEEAIKLFETKLMNFEEFTKKI